MNSTVSLKNQSGVALAVGLIFLLMLTILGITAVRMGTQQTRMAANYQFQTAAFQASESQIRQIMAELRGEVAPPVGEGILLIEAISLGLNPVTPKQRTVDVDTEVVDPNDSSATIKSKDFTANGQLVYQGYGPVANYSLGSSITGHRFQIDSRATLANTGARAQHLQGMVRVGPLN
jgi:hypothetical protein